MNKKDFQNIIAKGETEHVEFKSGRPQPEFIARAVCAFLNRHGGRLFLGIGDHA